MKILLDTNVVLDVLLKREPFFEESYTAIKSSIEKGNILYVSASSITDIYYLLRKAVGSKDKALSYLQALIKVVSIASVDEKTIVDATMSKLNDFEDAVIDIIASSLNIDVIVTRNIKDFKKSLTKVLSPKQLIAI